MLLALVTAACPDLTPSNTDVIVWEGILVPSASYPDLGGQAAAVAQLSGTDLGIGITGATPGATHLWDVRTGTCAAPGDLRGTSADYPPLVVGDSGTSSAETHLGARFAADATYHAEVLAGDSDTSRIACGNLEKR